MTRKLSFLLLPGFVLIADQLSKFAVRESFYLGQTKTILPFLDFTYITNTGMAFGMMGGRNIFFIILTIIIVSLINIFRTKIFSTGVWAYISYSCITGGALGNLIDRIVFGKVIDFIDVRFWPVFNLADSFISIGAAIFIMESLFKGKTDASDTD